MFIDTNVLVYARIFEAPHHVSAREALQRAFGEDEPVRISRQVVREYLSVITRRQDWLAPFTPGEAVDDVRRLLNAFEMLEDGPEVTETLIALCGVVSAPGRQVHDANIVATMLTHGERRLLTFNTKDFRRYGERVELVETH